MFTFRCYAALRVVVIQVIGPDGEVLAAIAIPRETLNW